MRNQFLLFLCLCFVNIVNSQITLKGKIIDQSSKDVLSFATLQFNNEFALADMDGHFNITVPANQSEFVITFSFLGYKQQQITLKEPYSKFLTIELTPKEEFLEQVKIKAEDLSKSLIKKAIAQKHFNNPNTALDSYSHKSYNKFKITEENTVSIKSQDTSDTELELLFNDAHSFLSEKISEHKFKKFKGEQETVLASQMTGFDQPIYDVLGITIQSNTVYNEDYVIFNERYIGPLSKKALNNYHYKY